MKDEKMKDREMWMDKLKEKLENYSEPIPPFGWEQLEKELVPPVKKRILYPYRRWGAAAAAVLLVVASSLSIYFLNTPTADEIRLLRYWPPIPICCHRHTIPTCKWQRWNLCSHVR